MAIGSLISGIGDFLFSLPSEYPPSFPEALSSPDCHSGAACFLGKPWFRLSGVRPVLGISSSGKDALSVGDVLYVPSELGTCHLSSLPRNPCLILFQNGL